MQVVLWIFLKGSKSPFQGMRKRSINRAANAVLGAVCNNSLKSKLCNVRNIFGSKVDFFDFPRISNFFLSLNFDISFSETFLYYFPK